MEDSSVLRIPDVKYVLIPNLEHQILLDFPFAIDSVRRQLELLEQPLFLVLKLPEQLELLAQSLLVKHAKTDNSDASERTFNNALGVYITPLCALRELDVLMEILNVFLMAFRLL